jgi:hypothetical protein
LFDMFMVIFGWFKNLKLIKYMLYHAFYF